MLILEHYNINRDGRLHIDSSLSHMKKYNHLPLSDFFSHLEKRNVRDSQTAEKRSRALALKAVFLLHTHQAATPLLALKVKAT